MDRIHLVNLLVDVPQGASMNWCECATHATKSIGAPAIIRSLDSLASIDVCYIFALAKWCFFDVD